MTSELNKGPLTTSSGPHLEAVLVCILYPSVGGTHPEQDCILEASAEASRAAGMGDGGAGLNCSSGVKVFHRLTNTVWGCQSICSGGIPLAKRSNTRASQFFLVDASQPTGIDFRLPELFSSGLSHTCTYSWDLSALDCLTP